MISSIALSNKSASKSSSGVPPISVKITDPEIPHEKNENSFDVKNVKSETFKLQFDF